MDEMTLLSLIAFCTLMLRRLVIFSPIFMFCEMMTFVASVFSFVKNIQKGMEKIEKREFLWQVRGHDGK